MNSLMKYLQRLGSPGEQVPGTAVKPGMMTVTRTPDIDKVIYRAMTILIAPTMEFREEILEGKLLSEDEARQMLKEAHPWFKKCLATTAGKTSFEMNYHFVREAWDETDSQHR